MPEIEILAIMFDFELQAIIFLLVILVFGFFFSGVNTSSSVPQLLLGSFDFLRTIGLDFSWSAPKLPPTHLAIVLNRLASSVSLVLIWRNMSKNEACLK